MELQTKKVLSNLTNDFYVRTATSFSETRTAPWHGWQQVLDLMQSRSASPVLEVFDVGCGNLRFEKFLAKRGVSFQATCVDNCEALVAEGIGFEETVGVAFLSADVMELLLEQRNLGDELGLTKLSFDLACAFGFFHHIPGVENRRDLLRELLQLVKPGGLVALSFWQFERDDRIFAKAQEATERAKELYALNDLEDGDYLLGWKDNREVFRYCHSFSETEINELIRGLSPAVFEVARFSADGKSGDLNRYVVLERL